MSIFKDQFPRIGASGQSTGFTIDQSVRFDAASSSELQISNAPDLDAAAGGKLTYSFWLKRAVLGSTQTILKSDQNSDNYIWISIQSSDQLSFDSQVGGSSIFYLRTSGVLRDPSAWYHIVLNVDTSQAVQSERVKIFLNGTRVANLDQNNYPSLNQDIGPIYEHNNNPLYIGEQDDTGNFSSYYLAEYHSMDNYAYGPEYFGEFKEDTDIWIPKEVSGVSYGTGGWYLDFSNAAELGTDTSGAGNTFAEIGGLDTHDQMIDTPTNNFCVMNPIYADNSATNSLTSSEGNLKLAGTSSGFDFVSTTFNLPKSGKWYYEYTIGGGYDGFGFFIQGEGGTAAGANGLGQLSTSQGGGIQYRGWRNGGSYTTTFADYASGIFSSGEIHQVAIDVDNNDLYYGIANVYQAADAGKDGNPSSGSNPLLADFAFSTNDIVLAHMVATDSNPEHFNFGQNGTFNGTKTAQGNTDANGIGNFYYAVPTGFLALCSSNLGAV